MIVVILSRYFTNRLFLCCLMVDVSVVSLWSYSEFLSDVSIDSCGCVDFDLIDRSVFLITIRGSDSFSYSFA